MPSVLARLSAAFLPLLSIQPAHKAGDCIVLDAGGFTVATRDYIAQAQPGKEPAIGLELKQPADAKALEQLSARQVGGQLAMALDGVIVAAPTVRAPLKGPHIELSFNDTQGFDVITAALKGDQNAVAKWQGLAGLGCKPPRPRG